MPLPELPLRPVSDRELLAFTPPGIRPTPALDAAVERARFERPLDPPAIEAPKPEQSGQDRATGPRPDPAGLDLQASRPEGIGATNSHLIEPGGTVGEQDAWRRGLTRLIEIAHRLAEHPDEERSVWAARECLLAWLSQDDDPEGRRETLATILALSAQRPTPTPPEEATTEEPAPGLRIAEFRLCRRVRGFGQFEAIDPDSCQPGQSLILYCELEGLSVEAAGDHYRTRLEASVGLYRDPGEEPIWSQDLGTADDLCRRPRRDFFVNYRIHLPDTLAPGSYRLEIVQQDRVSGRDAKMHLKLSIRP